jgi:hypothetical protein
LIIVVFVVFLLGLVDIIICFFTVPPQSKQRVWWRRGVSNSVTQQVHLIDKLFHALATAVDQKIVGYASFFVNLSSKD